MQPQTVARPRKVLDEKRRSPGKHSPPHQRSAPGSSDVPDRGSGDFKSTTKSKDRHHADGNEAGLAALLLFCRGRIDDGGSQVLSR